MLTTERVKVFLTQFLVFLAFLACLETSESLIITSVLAGDKKFKTISFDHPWIKPLTFEKEMPTTEFRRHRTLRPPKFDIDVNIPIKLPLEDEYPQEEYKKPIESEFFFQSGDIHEPNSYGAKKQASYGKRQNGHRDEYAAASESNNKQVDLPPAKPTSLVEQGFKLLPTLARHIRFQPKIEFNGQGVDRANARSDTRAPQSPPNSPSATAPAKASILQAPQQGAMMTQESYPHSSAARKPYAGDSYHEKPTDFVPGGFVNLQLSGPTGGPKMTYEDFDREKWAQQLSQTAFAMPYPILDYHQLQNFYGGLGTFTNGLPNNNYVETSLLDKFKSTLFHFTDKLHFG